MKAVIWHDVGRISVDEVPDPMIAEPIDAIVRITTSAICATDLHFVRGTTPGMREGSDTPDMGPRFEAKPRLLQAAAIYAVDGGEMVWDRLRPKPRRGERPATSTVLSGSGSCSTPAYARVKRSAPTTSW
jgi:hypothetical protein